MSELDIYVSGEDLNEDERSYFGISVYVFLQSTGKYYKVDFRPPQAIIAVADTHFINDGIPYENMILVKDLRNDTIKWAAMRVHYLREFFTNVLVPIDTLDLKDGDYQKI